MFELPYPSRVVKKPKNLEDITKFCQDDIATTIAAKVVHKSVVVPQLDPDVLQMSYRITVTNFVISKLGSHDFSIGPSQRKRP
jgi:hypothetical protein